MRHAIRVLKKIKFCPAHEIGDVCPQGCCDDEGDGMLLSPTKSWHRRRKRGLVEMRRQEDDCCHWCGFGIMVIGD